MGTNNRYAMEPPAVVLVRALRKAGRSIDQAAQALVAQGAMVEYWSAWSWVRREYLYASVHRCSFADKD